VFRDQLRLESHQRVGVGENGLRVVLRFVARASGSGRQHKRAFTRARPVGRAFAAGGGIGYKALGVAYLVRAMTKWLLKSARLCSQSAASSAASVFALDSLLSGIHHLGHEDGIQLVVVVPVHIDVQRHADARQNIFQQIVYVVAAYIKEVEISAGVR
jgi:hypothetical protein